MDVRPCVPGKWQGVRMQGQACLYSMHVCACRWISTLHGVLSPGTFLTEAKIMESVLGTCDMYCSISG